ncbi:hypothetical protein [Bartonella tamiae]|nr:hypothetical protein [Bartonella tamiae]
MALAPADIEKMNSSLLALKSERAVNVAGQVTSDKRFLFKNFESNRLKVSNAIIIENANWATTVDDNGTVKSSDSSSINMEYSIAGRGLFNDYLVIFDFKQNEILLYSGSDREKYIASNVLKEIDGSINKKGIEINAIVDDKYVVLVLDTGSTMSVVKLTGSHKYGVTDECHWQYPNIVDKFCYVGSFQYDSKSAAYPILVWNRILENFDTDGLLGMDNIKSTIFIIDFIDKKVYHKG